MSEVPEKAFFIGHNALGDTLCTTPVVRAYRRIHPDSVITYIVHDVDYCRVLEAHPDIDLVVYSEVMQFHGLRHYSQHWARMLPLDLTEPAPFLHFNIDLVAAIPGAFENHISEGFAKLLEIPITSTRPVVELNDRERRRARRFKRRPYVIFSMHSNSNVPEEGREAGPKAWPRHHWWRLAGILREQYDLDVIAVGSERDAQEQCPYIRNLYGLPILTAAALIEGAECVVTLENGLAHLAAAVDAPTVVIYSPIVPLEWASPGDVTYYRAIFRDPESISVEEILALVEPVAARSKVPS